MIAEPNLAGYDVILVNSSGGKDSQAMLDLVAERAAALGLTDRIVIVHCDLGRVEWAETRAIAEQQARHYGCRFEVVSRPQGDLLQQVEEHGMWPGPKTRFCTSDHKRGQVYTLMTRLVRELHGSKRNPVRILNCMGLRADESPGRRKKKPFCHNPTASNGKRHVDDWLPIHGWTEPLVWDRIKRAGTRTHYAYSLGMPRVSCCFCIYSPKQALLLAGHHNLSLLKEYARVEKKINHRFRQDVSLQDILIQVEAGVQPAAVPNWTM